MLAPYNVMLLSQIQPHGAAEGCVRVARERVEGLVKIAQKAVMGVVNFTLSIPGKLVGVVKMSSAERGEMYRGWWKTIKKESYHYYVSSWLTCHGVPGCCGHGLGSAKAALGNELLGV